MKAKNLIFSIISRNFLKPNHILRRVLSDEEKLEFVKTFTSWIEERDIMDTCFILNFGYDSPLPWPQVLSRYLICIFSKDRFCDI